MIMMIIMIIAGVAVARARLDRRDHRAAALDFLAFATGAERQSAQAALTGYGPSRRSAGALAASAGAAPFSPKPVFFM